MKYTFLGGSVLGVAALISLAGLASADTAPRDETPRVSVACGADVVPPDAKAGKAGAAKAGKGAFSSAERAGGGASDGAAPPTGKKVTSTAEFKDGKLYIDGKEQAIPADCGDGEPMTISVEDTATK